MNFKTTDLCDEHGDALRVMEPMFASFGGHTACSGPVRTLRVFEDNALVRATLTEPGNGAVLVVDGGGSLRCALLGDQLAQLAVDNGWSGVVVWGCIRDSAQVETMPVAVFALATHPRRPAKKGIGERDVPVTFGGHTLRPGDYLYADEDGIVVAAQRLAG
jgi:regulator of ribonuclease activity A